MSKSINLRAASKIQWTVEEKNGSPYPGDDNISLGCLMRIADATEAMAVNHVRLQNDHDQYKRWYQEGQEKISRLEKANAAHRGHYRRLYNNTRKK